MHIFWSCTNIIDSVTVRSLDHECDDVLEGSNPFGVVLVQDREM